MAESAPTPSGNERSVPPEFSTPPCIPDYELLRCIGRGSYGAVWLARQAAGTFRAVKVVYRKTFEHDRPFERELSGIQKFEPISRSHPSQVSILQVGRNQEAGYFYYVMELADDAAENPKTEIRNPNEPRNPNTETESSSGATSTSDFGLRSSDLYVPRTLKLELQRKGRLPFDDCLRIGLALATALDHLHQHGLVHRDIKPSNVIFVNGVPKLADIGLVTDVGATISFVGTEGFLPPEGPGTPQADLYSLGKVLYEISTGHDRMDFPELPTFADETAARGELLELNLIFLRACQNEVRKRYQSARELFSDLMLLQGGKSLRHARALEQRLAKARNVAIAVTLLVAGVAVGNHLLQQRRLTRMEQEKNRMAQEAEQEASASRRVQERFQEQTRQLADLYWDKGDRLSSEGDVFGALLWFGKALTVDPPDPLRRSDHRQKIASLRQRCPSLALFLTHDGAINSAAFSADGRRVVTASEDQTAQVWDAGTGDPIGPPLTHAGIVRHAELSADGERVLTLTDHGLAQIWTALTGEPVSVKLDLRRPLRKVRFSPTGRQVLTVSDGPEALLWETSSARLRFTLTHQARVLEAAFSPDGRLVATVSGEPAARVWNVETGEPVTAGLTTHSAITGEAFSPDSRRLVTVSGAQAQVWDARSGERASWSLRQDDPMTAAAFSPDGRRLVTAGQDHTARIWDAVTGQLLAPVLRHEAPVGQAVFSPDGRFLATTSSNRVQIWDALTFAPQRLSIVHNASLRDVCFSPSGHCLLTASADGTARSLALGENSLRGPASSAGDDENLARWAQLLSGRRVSPEGKTAPLDLATMRQSWRVLKAKDLPAFGPVELSSWHQRSAEICEQAQHWFGAVFHWQRAVALNPGERSLGERLAHAATALAREEANAARPPELPSRIPARAAGADPHLIDLSAFYNAALTETWFPTNVIPLGNDLSALPRGVQKFAGVEFDVRGIVQLSGSALENLGGRFPREVRGIPVSRKCRRLHLLHDAGWSAPAGTHIGSYVVRYADGAAREIKIVFGQNVREWWFTPSSSQLITGAALAWEGSNPASRAMGMRVRLYQMIWINPWPEVEVASIDFKSTMENPAPFLIAITAE